MSTPIRTQKDLDECLKRIYDRMQMEERRERGVWFTRLAAWVTGVMVLCLVIIAYRGMGGL